jgi:hypothetical protein
MKMTIHMDNREIKVAVDEYLTRRGYKVEAVNLKLVTNGPDGQAVASPSSLGGSVEAEVSVMPTERGDK